MNLLIVRLIYISIIYSLNRCQEESEKKMENEKNCRERNRLITTDKGDIFTLIDATIGENLILQCHYCKEHDDQQPKIWYKIKTLTNPTPQEVTLGMDSNSSHNRIQVGMEHSLIFQNVTADDAGYYYCIGLDEQKSENRFSYLIDIVFDNNVAPESGNLTAWRKYHDDYFVSVNRLFNSSTNPEYAYIRTVLRIKIAVVTEWDPWGHCEICGRPQGEGRKRKKGFCRLKMSPIPNNYTVVPRNDDELFFLDAYELSCRSQFVGKLFPAVSNITRLLPHFVQAERCEGTCNPDAEGLGRGWKTSKRLGFKYRKTYVLAHNDHLTLVCPDSTLENVIVWRRNGKVLTPGQGVQLTNATEEEPKIRVDTFNTLYLHGVTQEEEGNYTCQVDETRMIQVRVFVVSKTRILTQAFLRHMMYLAFVLSLTLSCYCAGLGISWKKRHSFKGYEELLLLTGNAVTNENDVN